MDINVCDLTDELYWQGRPRCFEVRACLSEDLGLLLGVHLVEEADHLGCQIRGQLADCA